MRLLSLHNRNVIAEQMFQSRRPGFGDCDLERVTLLEVPLLGGFSPVDRDLGIATQGSLDAPQLQVKFQSRRPGFGDCDIRVLSALT